MANITTIARPYAKAVFELARQTGSFAHWSRMLEFLTLVVHNKQANKLIRNQAIMPQTKADFINTIAPDQLNSDGQNLVKELAHNRRLLIIPVLYKLFDDMRKEFEHRVTLQVFLASELEKTEIAKLRDDFAKLVQGEVTLLPEIDPSLIGGGKLKIGDRVLESSIKGSLQQLYKHLTHEQVTKV